MFVVVADVSNGSDVSKRRLLLNIGRCQLQIIRTSFDGCVSSECPTGAVRLLFFSRVKIYNSQWMKIS
jgi:hypothetical protein